MTQKGLAMHLDDMKNTVALAALIMIAAPAVASAETEGTVVRLSAEDVEAAKEAAAKRNLASHFSGEQNAVANDKRNFFGPVHGEVGFGIGTGGYREAFGTAVMPLGEDGLFAFSFDTVQFNDRRRVRR
jgi:hypothetical protein